MTVTRYSLTKPGAGPFTMVTLVLMGAFGVWATLWRDFDKLDTYRICFTVVWVSILGWAAYRQVTSAREIVVHENDEVEFVSWAGRIRMPARDIHSVKATGGEQSHIAVRHAGGTIYLAGNFDRLHQFLSDLERANPAVVFSGC